MRLKLFLFLISLSFASLATAESIDAVIDVLKVVNMSSEADVPRVWEQPLPDHLQKEIEMGFISKYQAYLVMGTMHTLGKTYERKLSSLVPPTLMYKRWRIMAHDWDELADRLTSGDAKFYSDLLAWNAFVDNGGPEIPYDFQHSFSHYFAPWVRSKDMNEEEKRKAAQFHVDVSISQYPNLVHQDLKEFKLDAGSFGFLFDELNKHDKNDIPEAMQFIQTQPPEARRLARYVCHTITSQLMGNDLDPIAERCLAYWYHYLETGQD